MLRRRTGQLVLLRFGFGCGGAPAGWDDSWLPFGLAAAPVDFGHRGQG